MFPFGFILPVGVLLLFSVAAALFGYIGGGTLVLAWVLTFVVVFGALLAIDGQGGVRRTGAALLSTVVLGLGFAYGMHPVLAHAATDLVWHGGLASDLLSPVADGTPLIVAPPADTGFWGSLNGYLATGVGTIVAAFVAWAAKEIATHTRIAIRADQEAQIRETLKTGAYAAMHNLEIEIDDHWTPAQRQKVLGQMVAWVEQRAATQLKKLGLPNFVVTAMAGKVLGQLQGFGFSADGFEAALAGGAPLFTGNPGETPALDRVDGGKGGN